MPFLQVKYITKKSIKNKKNICGAFVEAFVRE